ncbi:MAG: c-type cytochrome [Burkholderiales bacterium]
MALTTRREAEMKALKYGAAALAAMAVMSGTAWAEGVTVSVSGGEKIFRNGKGDAVPACVSCHGDTGMGNDAMGTPRLANQGYTYLVKQLSDFASNKRTDMTLGVMNGIAKSLTDQDMRNLAYYLHTLKVKPELSNLDDVKASGKPVGIRYEGESIAKFGIESKGVSACLTCHQYNGRGAAPVYPMIGQQKYVYLVNQLTHWRDGSRANDPMGQMRAIAKNLSDADIQNVATYLATAPKSTEGDTYHYTNSPEEGITVTP